MADAPDRPEVFGDFGQYMSHKTHPKSFKRLLPPDLSVEKELDEHSAKMIDALKKLEDFFKKE